MELNQKFPFIDWQAFFKQAFAEVLASKPDLLFQIKILVQEDFLKGVNQLVVEHQKEERGRQVLVNYMIWRLLAAFYPDRPPDEIQRKERCLKETEDMFAPVVTAMYIRDKGVEASEQIVQQVDMMVDIMKDAFKHNLPKLSWMSAFSLAAAEEKLEHMVDLIGKSPVLLDLVKFGIWEQAWDKWSSVGLQKSPEIEGNGTSSQIWKHFPFVIAMIFQG